jgi:hypothetical protein
MASLQFYRVQSEMCFRLLDFVEESFVADAEFVRRSPSVTAGGGQHFRNQLTFNL